MTMKQIKQTGKMMRKTCMPKNNVEEGKFPVSRIKNGLSKRSKAFGVYKKIMYYFIFREGGQNRTRDIH